MMFISTQNLSLNSIIFKYIFTIFPSSINKSWNFTSCVYSHNTLMLHNIMFPLDDQASDGAL